MALEPNTVMATEAVRYTLSKLTIGASTKWSDIWHTGSESFICFPAMRFVELLQQFTDELKYLRSVASVAEHVGCGNCGENAAIAFIYLLDRSVRPLDLMSGGPVDHAFVVLGRPAQSTASDPTTWGKEAVVCDPW